MIPERLNLKETLWNLCKLKRLKVDLGISKVGQPQQALHYHQHMLLLVIKEF